MTPLHLSIALHYHVSPEQWPQLHIEAHRDYANDLVRAGMLQHGAGLSGTGYIKTEGLAVWIEAICATPFPIQRWVMPSPDAR